LLERAGEHCRRRGSRFRPNLTSNRHLKSYLTCKSSRLTIGYFSESIFLRFARYEMRAMLNPALTSASISWEWTMSTPEHEDNRTTALVRRDDRGSPSADGRVRGRSRYSPNHTKNSTPATGVGKRSSSTTTDSSVRRIEFLLQLNPERKLPVPEVSSWTGLSRSGLSHWFKNRTGTSPARYIKSVRMARAKKRCWRPHP